MDPSSPAPWPSLIRFQKYYEKMEDEPAFQSFAQNQQNCDTAEGFRDQCPEIDFISLHGFEKGVSSLFRSFEDITT
ncbi:unnamed protein product [Clonostachys rosea]|uniref:Uncharacterized protein n=1 Tax=Bionectria ochroleuca TaxID=29856 RepID=A0ABY6UE66_BIOOC|nr:unnamed protein product [Clonostachys rosea]